MFSGPMFGWEYQAATRGRRTLVLRTFVAVVLAVATLLVGFFIFARDLSDGSEPPHARLTTFGRAAFTVAIGLELLILVFIVPASVGGAIAEERERNTLPLLLLTRLAPLEIVLTKTAARSLPTINVVMTGLPVFAVSAWAAGLEVELVLALLGLVSSSAFMATLAILASAQREQAGTARAQATAWTFGWLLGPPLVTILPIRTGTLLGELLAALKAGCALAAPSSPLSLVTDPGWYNRRGGVSLGDRLAVMIGLQALFGLLAIGFAASRLKAREQNPNWVDPTRGYRPACGDDPIYWLEFELPTRRGGGSMFRLRLRYMVILIRVLLINTLALAAVLFALAVPLALLGASVHYGTAAVQELWWNGYGRNGPFRARAHFNMLVRVVTALLALLPALGLSSLVAARITTERDRKTWDALLTTPLSGEEILRSKTRVALDGLRQSAWPLPILWALGIAFGVVLPGGVVLAALDLLLIVWATLALGLYLGIRPGTTTSAASNRAAMSTLVLLVLHTPVLWAVLVSPRELAVFTAWSARLRWGLVLLGAMVPLLTARVAWFLTRQTIERFDEWVGRPHRTPANPRAADMSLTL